MSADNGYVIQRNKAGRYTLQMYFASTGYYPDPEKSGRLYATLEDAALAYDAIAQSGEIIEYGLQFDLSQKTPVRKDGDLVAKDGQVFCQVGWQINGGEFDTFLVNISDQEWLDKNLPPHGGFSPVYVEVGTD